MRSGLFNFFHRKKDKVQPTDILPVTPKTRDHQRFIHQNVVYSVYKYPERENLFYITKASQPLKLVTSTSPEQALLSFLNGEDVVDDRI